MEFVNAASHNQVTRNGGGRSAGTTHLGLVLSRTLSLTPADCEGAVPTPQKGQRNMEHAPLGLHEGDELINIIH